MDKKQFDETNNQKNQMKDDNLKKTHFTIIGINLISFGLLMQLVALDGKAIPFAIGTVWCILGALFFRRGI